MVPVSNVDLHCLAVAATCPLPFNLLRLWEQIQLGDSFYQ